MSHIVSPDDWGQMPNSTNIVLVLLGQYHIKHNTMESLDRFHTEKCTNIYKKVCFIKKTDFIALNRNLFVYGVSIK